MIRIVGSHRRVAAVFSSSSISTTTTPIVATATERKMTALELQHLRRQGKKISMITAYDYPSGKHAENAQFEIVLVGDS